MNQPQTEPRSARANQRRLSVRPLAVVLLALVTTMMLIVLRMELRRLFHRDDPIWAQHYNHFPRWLFWALIPHGCAAGLPLLLGPLQLWDGLRSIRPQWHRRLGWIYVVGVLVGAPSGLVIEYLKYKYADGNWPLVVANIGFCGLFVTSTVRAVMEAKRRRFPAHRGWMIRSYAFAVVFLAGRTFDEIPWLGRIVAPLSELVESRGVSDLWITIVLCMILGEAYLFVRSRPRQGLPDRTVP
jgi:uncharacterized membrane protein